MDIKTLFDECRDQGLTFGKNGNCDRDDVASVALEIILSDAREYSEHWADWIAVGFAENLEAKKVEYDCCLGRLEKDLHRADRDIASFRVGSSDGLKAAQASAVTQTMASIGSAFFELIKKGAEAYIEDNLDEWCDEVGGYYFDMEQAKAEDRAEAMAEERRGG